MTATASTTVEPSGSASPWAKPSEFPVRDLPAPQEPAVAGTAVLETLIPSRLLWSGCGPCSTR